MKQFSFRPPEWGNHFEDEGSMGALACACLQLA